MNIIKNLFSIKDLENLSGVKAHTIRIWEKRYDILQPMRTDTNIRYYDTVHLQKLLNISLLHHHGYKISEIAVLSDNALNTLVKETASDKSAQNHAVNAFKMAMMSFNQQLFIETYNNLITHKTFKEIFYEAFLPLLSELGLLWQTETITPAHEHFISHLIRLKLLRNTELIQANEPPRKDRVFILFLPLNEIHELGLLYVNYELLRHGYQTLYLGESIPKENLSEIFKHFENVTFVCYSTVEPKKEQLNDYIASLENELLQKANSKLWLLGSATAFINPKNISSKVVLINSLQKLELYL